MVVRARQNYFSPINGKTSKYCTAVRIFNADRSCEGITELSHTFFVLVISIAKSNQSPSKFAFSLSFLKRYQINFFPSMKKLRRVIFTTCLAWIKCQGGRIFGILETLNKLMTQTLLKELIFLRMYVKMLILSAFVPETCQTFTSILLMVLGMWYCLAITDDYKILQIQTQIPHMTGWKYSQQCHHLLFLLSNEARS